LRLLGRSTPDPRMRDVELLARYLSYRRFLGSYVGRIKEFIDQTCTKLNETWAANEHSVRDDINQFNSGIDSLMSIFGEDIARKPGSKSFNRAIFDALIFYASDKDIRDAMNEKAQEMRDLYISCFEDETFAEAIESDTAGIPHTFSRLSIWGERLRTTLGISFNVPTLEEPTDGSSRIWFNGFR
jgi:hypothetical protein